MSAVVANPTEQAPEQTRPQAAQPRGDLCFMETQFPVSKMSKESYTERMANTSQALTGLGKWWGRKPLVLCRAAILGLLLPATDDPQKDRGVFLRLMTMDDDGMLRRKSVNIPAKELFKRLGRADRERYFTADSTEDDARLVRGLSKEEKQELQRRVFLRLSYDERLEYCERPEQIDGPSPNSWAAINAHLGTDVTSLPALVAELGKRRFGHVPRVGDAFCGGGSIPFEAARLGCQTYGSDLNPVAALLTWAALNIVGGGEKVAKEVWQTQREIYDKVDREFTARGIEHRTEEIKPAEWQALVEQLSTNQITPADISRQVPRADLFFYCSECVCPETGWRVPLAPSWVIADKRRCVARLLPDRERKCYDIEIVSDVNDAEMEAAAKGTVQNGYVVHPILQELHKQPASIQLVRLAGRGWNAKAKYHESGLRLWENQDVIPQPGDVFQERLYCVRWVVSVRRENAKVELEWAEEKEYRTATDSDHEREDCVLQILREYLAEWQRAGFVPSLRIEPGAKTDEPIRTRGWTHWHHLFNPRQLLEMGFLLAQSTKPKMELEVARLLGIGSIANMSSKLTMWNNASGKENTSQTFSNQALNTLYNYPVRSHSFNASTWSLRFVPTACRSSKVEPKDCRAIEVPNDVWITDPPYADAVSYHELSEFFLAWQSRKLGQVFPDWATDSRRALAVTGDDEGFRRSMVDCYRNLAAHMPDNGIQVVMFTHQDAGVWADLSLILWAAGLRVTAAWCIATETESALKDGNYVQGTVLLVLRKQHNEATTFLDEVYQEVEAEVRRQLDTMRDLDDAKDPNFTDTDYQLAAYAAALRVLTAKKIEEIDVAYELTRTRNKGEKSPVEELIERAVKIACDHLVPKGIDTHVWKSLTASERFYLKGLELESHGERRNGVYQELARGFGFDDYPPLLARTKANETRLKTATEFAGREMSGSAASLTGFGTSLVRHALFAACKTGETESPRDGITWLTSEVKDYASSRQRVIEILEFLAALRQNASLPHWHKDAEAAGLLAGALRNRQDNV